MSELRDEDLKLAYWLSTHRQQVNKIASIIGWICVGIIWVIFFIYLIIYIAHYQSTQDAQDSMTNTSIIYSSIKAPATLQIVSASPLTVTATTIDAYGIIQNPNQYYVARFSYTITVNGQAYTFTNGVAQPNEKVYVVAPGLTIPATAGVTVAVSDVTWQRIHGVAPAVDFRIGKTEVAAVQAGTDGTASSTNTNTNTNSTLQGSFVVPENNTTTPTTTTAASVLTAVTSIITNNSPFGFQTVTVTVVLRDVSQHITGISQQVLHNVASFAAVPLRFNWERRFEFGTNAEVVVSTDYWDNANLIYPGQN